MFQTQTFTSSIFVKAAGSASVRFGLILDDGTTAEQNIFFDLNLSIGAIGSLFIPQGGITGDAYGAVPLGDGWYRLFITATFSFGFSTLRTSIIANSASGAQSWTGNGNTGIYLWGAKLTKFALDPYTATSGKIFYSDNEFNIKNFALDLLDGFIAQALAGTLTSPSTNAGFYSFYSSTAASDYTTDSITALAVMRPILLDSKSRLELTIPLLMFRMLFLYHLKRLEKEMKSLVLEEVLRLPILSTVSPVMHMQK